MNKKNSIIGGALGLLAGVPLLANMIGWSITLILMAVLVVMAVRIWREVHN